MRLSLQAWQSISIPGAGALAEGPAGALPVPRSAAVCGACGWLEWQCGAGPHHR